MRLILLFLVCLCSYAQFVFPLPGPTQYVAATDCTGSCSDSFGGTSGTLLATHDPRWSGSNVGYCSLSGSSTVQTTTSYATCSAIYRGSTSDVSQIVANGFTGGNTPTNKCVVLRSDSGNSTSYRVCLGTASGGNWTRCIFYKNATQLAYASISSSQSTDHVLKAVASGTSSVTLTAYIDGTLSGTATDSSSALTSGYPGFFVTGNGTTANNQMSAWQDH